MIWQTMETAPLGEILVGLDKYGVYFVWGVDPDDWIECERDGSYVFGRDGSPVSRSPTHWVPLPETARE